MNWITVTTYCVVQGQIVTRCIGWALSFAYMKDVVIIMNLEACGAKCFWKKSRAMSLILGLYSINHSTNCSNPLQFTFRIMLWAIRTLGFIIDQRLIMSSKQGEAMSENWKSYRSFNDASESSKSPRFERGNSHIGNRQWVVKLIIRILFKC